MSHLSDRLADLLADSNMNIKTFALRAQINATCVTHYLQGTRLPTVKNLIKIADFFQCSCDYLLGREEENYSLTFKTSPPFPECIELLKKEFKCKDYYFYNGTGISKSRFFDWKKGLREPSLDNVIKIAELFNCRVDFVLGRE